MKKMTQEFRAGLAAILVITAAPAFAADPPGDAPALEGTRATVEKWVETQEIIARESKDWQTGKEVLERRIDLIRGEITGLEQRIGDLRGSLSQTGDKRGEIQRESRDLELSAATIEKAMPRLEAKALGLLPRLPAPLRDRVSPLTDRIPRPGTETKLSLSQRFQNVIGALNEINKSTRDAPVTGELLDMGGGRRAEVQTLYVGLGQGYYVTADGSAAGYGLAGAESWDWTPANEIAREVSAAISILENEKEPAYVPVPVTIR